jgi:hypothetical protein
MTCFPLPFKYKREHNPSPLSSPGIYSAAALSSLSFGKTGKYRYEREKSRKP